MLFRYTKLRNFGKHFNFFVVNIVNKKKKKYNHNLNSTQFKS